MTFFTKGALLLGAGSLAACSLLFSVDDYEGSPDAGGASSGGAEASTPPTTVRDAGGGDARVEPVEASAPGAGCPAALPGSWIFCDDFEAESDPASRYARFDNAGGTFKRTAEQGASGTHSMQVVQPPGALATGSLTVVFGKNPLGSTLRATEDFQTVYVRLRVKHEPGPAGDLGWTRIRHRMAKTWIAANASGGSSLYVHTWNNWYGGDPSFPLLALDPAICMSDAGVTCPTFDSELSAVSWPARIPAVTSIIEDRNEDWHCLETRVTLGDVGAANDSIALAIDGIPNAAQRASMRLRPVATPYALNAVTIENGEVPPGVYGYDAGTTVLRRWIDDVVIATEPIGCD